MWEQACIQCSKRCSKIHGNGKKKGMSSSGDVSTQVSFFKIMIGDFEEAMFIPPKLAQSFWHLCNKDTCLEDSEGHSQKVVVSVVDGSLAFQKGWRDFVLDHSIRVGELVVFKYTNNSFSVQIFAKSACERLHFSETSNGNKRKRKKVNTDTAPILFEENNKSSEPSKDKSFVIDEDLVKEDMAIEPITELYVINTETSPNLLPFEENNKSSETSKDKLCATDEVPVKEAMAIELLEPIPELYGIEMTARICVTDGVEEGLAILNSLELPIASPMKYSEAPCNMNSDAVEIEECGKVSLVNLCDDDMEIEVPTRSLEGCGIDGKEDLVASDGLIGKYPLTCNHTTSMVDHLEPESTVFEQEETHIAPIHLKDPGTIEIQRFPEDTSTLLLDVEKLLRQHKMFQTKPMVECNEYEIVNQSETNWALVPCPSTEQGLSIPSRVDCSQGKNISDSGSLREQGEEKINAADKQMIDCEPDIEDKFDTSSSSFTGVNFNTDETETVFASISVVQEFLTSKEQTCCNIDEDLKCKSEANGDSPIGMPCTEKEESPCPSNEAVIARNKSYACEDSIEVTTGATTININCIEDVKGNAKPSFQPINDNQIKYQFGDIPASVSGVANGSRLGAVGSDTLTTPDPSELPKDPERNSSQTGIMPEDSPYVNSNANAKEITFASPRVVRKIRISEEETCCILDEDLSDNVEADRDALMSLYPIEREESARPCNEAVVAKHNSYTFEHPLEAPSGPATTNCTKYFRRNAIPSSEMITETLIKEQLGDVPASGSRVVSVSGLDTVGSDTLTNSDPSEFRKDLERKPFQTDVNSNTYEMESCCNMDGSSTDKFEADKDAPIGMCIEREGSSCPSNEAARYKSNVCEDSLQVPSGAAPTKCTEDVKGNAMPISELTKDIKTKELGDVASSGSGLVNTSGLDAVGSDTLTPPDTSELPKDSERNYFTAGITPVDSPDVYCNADEKKLFASNMVVPEFLISKEEACCNMDEDLSKELEADSNAPIDMCPSDEAIVERKKSYVCEGIFEEPSCAATTKCTKDIKGNEMPKVSPDMGCNVDEKNSLFGSNTLVRESLVSEKETCYNMDEDVAGELEADRDPPIRTYHIVRRHSAYSSRKAVRESNKSHVCEAILEVPSSSATTNCTKDVSGNEMPPSEPIKDTHVIEQLGRVPVSGSGLLNATTSLDTVGSNTSITPNASKFRKDPDRNTFPIGIMPKGSPKVDNKKVVSSVRGKPSGVVKTERMDSEDRPSSNNATSKFAFSVPVNAKSWLELPKRLPACLRKRNTDRNVVILRDLKMRTWPVLYQENTKFVGFIGGWKEFTTANNLRKGYVCHFEHIEGPEPTYQMRRRTRANISNMKP